MVDVVEERRLPLVTREMADAMYSWAKESKGDEDAIERTLRALSEATQCNPVVYNAVMKIGTAAPELTANKVFLLAATVIVAISKAYVEERKHGTT